MRNNPVDQDTIEYLIRRLNTLDDQVKQIQNGQIPTVPRYDQTNWPQDAAEGQLAMGSDDLLYKYQDGTWAPVGGTGGGPVAACAYTGNTLNVAANSGGSMPFIAPPFFGPALLDLTTPATPHVLTTGWYQFIWQVRLVIALGGLPAPQQMFGGIITMGGGVQPMGFCVIPASSSGSYVPAFTITTHIAHITTSVNLDFSVNNYDTTSNRVFNSAGLGVIQVA